MNASHQNSNPTQRRHDALNLIDISRHKIKSKPSMCQYGVQCETIVGSPARTMKRNTTPIATTQIHSISVLVKASEFHLSTDEMNLLSQFGSALTSQKSVKFFKIDRRIAIALKTQHQYVHARVCAIYERMYEPVQRTVRKIFSFSLSVAECYCMRCTSAGSIAFGMI